jgi:Mg2+ and Co2+ transporter CorA
MQCSIFGAEARSIPYFSRMRRVFLLVKRLMADDNQVILAVIALSLAIQDVVFGVTDDWFPFVEWAQFGIIGLYLLEWCASLYLATDRTAHIQDLRTIGGLWILGICLLAFTPTLGHVVIERPILKFLRITPALFFGFLAIRPLFVRKRELEPVRLSEEVRFQRLDGSGEGEISSAPISEGEFTSWLADPERQGCFCAIGDQAGMFAGSLTKPQGVPASAIQSSLAITSHPRISRLGRTLVFAGAFPSVTESGAEIGTIPFAFACTSKSLVLAESQSSVGTAVCQFLNEKRHLPGEPLNVRVTMALFHILLVRYEEAAERLSSEVRHLMMMQTGQDVHKAYMAAFNLQKTLARLKSDMWRLGRIFDRLEKGKLALPFEGSDHRTLYESLSDTCDYTEEAFSQLHEAATSAIDLRLNLASFQMNRFMGLMAVVTTVAIIPATMSGMLGINIASGNFPVSLVNVVFWAVMAIVLVLYFLKTRGWLRF